MERLLKNPQIVRVLALAVFVSSITPPFAVCECPGCTCDANPARFQAVYAPIAEPLSEPFVEQESRSCCSTSQPGKRLPEQRPEKQTKQSCCGCSKNQVSHESSDPNAVEKNGNCSDRCGSGKNDCPCAQVQQEPFYILERPQKALNMLKTFAAISVFPSLENISLLPREVYSSAIPRAAPIRLHLLLCVLRN